MKRNYIIYLCLALGLLSSCVTSRRVNYLQEPDKTIPAYDDTITYKDYTLQIGDRLYILVYSIDEKITALFNGGTNSNMMSQIRTGNSSNTDLYTYLVDPDGNITFPTIGKVHVQGRTTREVKHLIEDGLSGVIIQEGDMPNISVEVQIVQRFFSVIGASASGRFAINKEKVTIFEALAMARDIADFGDRAKIHIVREQGDSTIIKQFDVRSADIINSEFYYIEPNDVIYIPKIKGQAFGLNSAAAGVAVVASTFSFGVFIYTLIDRFIVQPVQNNQNQ